MILTRPHVVHSHSHRRVLLLARHTSDTRGRWVGGLQRPVAPVCGVQEGRCCGHLVRHCVRHRVGIADVLRVQELALVGHDLCGLLAVQH